MVIRLCSLVEVRDGGDRLHDCSTSSESQPRPMKGHQSWILGPALGHLLEFSTFSLIWKCLKWLKIVTSLITGNKGCGADPAVVIGGRPRTTEIVNINSLILPDILRGQCNACFVHPVSTYAVEGLGLYSTKTCIKKQGLWKKTDDNFLPTRQKSRTKALAFVQRLATAFEQLKLIRRR